MSQHPIPTNPVWLLLVWFLHQHPSYYYFSLSENILYYDHKNEFNSYILPIMSQLENGSGIRFRVFEVMISKIAVLRGRYDIGLRQEILQILQYCIYDIFW